MLNDLKDLFGEPKTLPLVIFVGAFIKMLFDISRDRKNN
jgi:hypothetical protein